MTRLHDLFDAEGQSPWLDNIKRGYLTGGQLQRLVDDGVRGLTSNPTIFEKAITGSSDYDSQFRDLVGSGTSIDDAYWDMAVSDIEGALGVLAPVHEASGGADGFVSIEVSPTLARDTEGTIAAARALHQRIDRPNLLVKIPGTAEGLPAIEQMIAEGRNVNVTLLFSLERYGEVIDAYIRGLQRLAGDGGDLSRVNSVASFFISRVDTEVDRRLSAIGTPEALALQGKAGVAQGKLAYELFRERFGQVAWTELAAGGAKVQRPLWASTSTKNPDYPDTMYVDDLIGPDTVNTMPDTTLGFFADHGTVARTIDVGVDDARDHLRKLGEVGVDMKEVDRVLEDEGVASFAKDFSTLLTALEGKAEDLQGGS